MDNVARLRKKIVEVQVPALLMTDMTNVRWLTGFTGSYGWVILTPNDGALLTDGRYTIQAREEVEGLDVRTFVTPQTMIQLLDAVAEEMGVKQIAFERSVSYATYDDWRKKLKNLELIDSEDLVAPLRMVKSRAEIEKVEEACALADACMTHVIRLLQPGVSEYDIGLDIEFFFRRQKAGIAFPPIVASGPNSARPHARPTERKLERGDFVTLDFGATIDGYSSDITRTFVIGHASERHEQVYGAVLEAQIAAIEAIQPGGDGQEIDRVARDTLAKYGLAEAFAHSLGHGLGRAVHDYGRLGPGHEQPLEVGQIWTIEPGVYLEGFGGVRIEDDIVIEAEGARVLTHSPKELTVL